MIRTYSFIAIGLFALTIIIVALHVDTNIVDTSKYPNRIYLIRHAEKGFTNRTTLTAAQAKEEQSLHGGRKQGLKKRGGWGHGPPGRGPPGRKFPSGLSELGYKRAEFIRELFANGTEYDIGKIFAAPREPPKETERTYATVAPLAKSLDLEIDIDCAETGALCVAQHAEDFLKHSGQDILISWKHRDLNGIATALGARNARSIYPDERNDIIWVMQHGRIIEKRSMHCPVLDDGRIDEGDPDLEVEEDSFKLGNLFRSVKGLWHLLG